MLKGSFRASRIKTKGRFVKAKETFKLNDLFKGPISKYSLPSEALQVRISIYEVEIVGTIQPI